MSIYKRCGLSAVLLFSLFYAISVFGETAKPVTTNNRFAIPVSGADSVFSQQLAGANPLLALLDSLLQRIIVSQAKSLHRYPLNKNTELEPLLAQAADRIVLTRAKVGSQQPLSYPAALINDTTAPQLLNAPTVTMDGSTTAMITWQTTEYAHSTVRYGSTADNLSETMTDGQYAKTHETTIAGLTPNATVYYQISLTDRSANSTPGTVLNFVVGAVSTATSTAGPTAAPTTTPQAPATATATSSPGQTPTSAPNQPSDGFEDNDSCGAAGSIANNGTVQEHTFHQQADEDWVKFEIVAESTYLIEVHIPPDSPADVVLETYTSCNNVPSQIQDHTFTPNARIEFTAVATGPAFLRITHHDPTIFGANVGYQLSVRELAMTASPGALIVVGGRLRVNDVLQPRIDHVTDQVYQLFKNQGYDDDRILYLSHNANSTGTVDGQPTLDNLRNGIVEWAAERVGPGQPLNLYLMDHGAINRLYLDKPAQQWLTPTDLDTWLSELELKKPNLLINVFVEMCHAGSFIQPPESISKPGRVVVTSTNVENVAYASNVGAAFSDHLIPALGQGSSLLNSFQAARAAARLAHPVQEPWLDGDGDGVPNELDDAVAAGQRGFGVVGSLPDETWPPYITQVKAPATIENGGGVITANVVDDIQVTSVWAEVYPPSFQHPTSGEELVTGPPPITLQTQGENSYAGLYTAFNEVGTYRIVVHAEDADRLDARPVVLEIVVGSQIYLPIVQP